MKTYAIVGLGNPGDRYHWTRHNVGKIFLENLSKAFGMHMDKTRDEFLWGEGERKDQKVLLVFPETFMNLSGKVIPWLKNKNVEIPCQLLVLSDDANLPVGTLRFREGGGAGGQKGLLSIIQAAGTDRIARIRIGIGSPPPGKAMSDFVLGNIPQNERELIIQAWEPFLQMVDKWLGEPKKTGQNV